METLLSNAAADEVGEAHDFTRYHTHVQVSGTFGGAVVTIEARFLHEPFVDLYGGQAFSAPGLAAIDLPPCEVRAVVTGGDETTSITVVLV